MDGHDLAHVHLRNEGKEQHHTLAVLRQPRHNRVVEPQRHDDAVSRVGGDLYKTELFALVLLCFAQMRRFFNGK